MAAKQFQDNFVVPYYVYDLIDNEDATSLNEIFDHVSSNIQIYPDGTLESETTPLLYAIRKGKNRVLETLIGTQTHADLQNQKKILVETSCIVGNSEALMLLCTVDRFKIRAKDIVKLCIEHPGVSILKVIPILSANIQHLHLAGIETINHTPTIPYFARNRLTESLESCLTFLQFCEQCCIYIDAGCPLHVSLMCGNNNFAKALVMKGASVDALNSRGQSLLYETLYTYYNQEMFKILLSHGANSQLGYGGGSVFQRAITSCDFPVLEDIINLDGNLVFEGSGPNYPIPHQFLGAVVRQSAINRSLHPISAPTADIMKIVLACLRKGFRINTKCKWNQTFFDRNFGGIDFSGHTVLHMAFVFCKSDLCEELLKLGADVKYTTDRNQSPYSLVLHVAMLSMDHGQTQFDYDDIEKKFSLLCQSGVNLLGDLPCARLPFTTPFLGTSPLSEVTQPLHPILLLQKNSGERKCLEFFIKFLGERQQIGLRELIVIITTGDFKTIMSALTYVQEPLNSLDLIQLKYLFLKSHNFPAAYFIRQFKILLMDLHRRGMSSHSVNQFGNCLFHYSARSSQMESEVDINEFVDIVTTFNGSRDWINARNIKGESPIHFALDCHSSDQHRSSASWIKVLVRRGANINVVTCIGYTAAHLAVNSCIPNEIVKIILGQGQRNLVNSGFEVNLCEGASQKTDDTDDFVTIFHLKMRKVITPMTIAIVKIGSEESEEVAYGQRMFRVLQDHGGCVTSTDLYNNLLVNGSRGIPALIWVVGNCEKVTTDILLKFDKCAECQPCLEIIYDHHLEDISKDDLMHLTKLYVDMGYNINSFCKYPHILSTAIRSKSASLELCRYILDCTSDRILNDLKVQDSSLLTHVLCKEHSALQLSEQDRQLLQRRRQAFAIDLLRRLCASNLRDISFVDYKYRIRDIRILKYLMLTPARTNLISAWNDGQIGLYNHLTKGALELSLVSKTHFPRLFKRVPKLSLYSFAALDKTNIILQMLEGLHFPTPISDLISLFQRKCNDQQFDSVDSSDDFLSDSEDF